MDRIDNTVNNGGFIPDILLLNQAPIYFFKENQNAPRPSEHPPIRGENMSKRLGGFKGYKYKTSS